MSFENFDTYAAYIRVSTDDQVEFSPAAQRSAILDYAKKNRIIVPEEYIFVDEGISGRKAEKRPAFMRMIATAKQKPSPFKGILVHKFDRFARSREDSVVYKSLLRKECGVQVISITEHIEDDKFSVILEAMLEAMAEYYSLNLSDEVMKGMTEKAKRGEYQSGAPLGYYMENKQLHIDEKSADIIRMIYRDFLGGMTEFSIAKKLNSLGYRTKRNNPFENRTVKYILQNPVYYGYVRWNVGKEKLRSIRPNDDCILKKGSHEPLISEEDWMKVQDRMVKKYRPAKRAAESRRHWLSGILYCSDCGSALSATKNGFQCIGYSKNRCSVSHYVSKPKIEAAVIEALLELKSSSEINYTVCTKNDYTSEIALLEKRLSVLATKERRIKEAYLNEIDSLEEYKVNKLHLSKEREEIEAALLQLHEESESDNKDEMRSRVSSVYDIISSTETPDVQKSEALNLIFDKIIYDKKTESLDFMLVYR